MKKILYLHGFASSPGGRKATALKSLLEPRGFSVVAPDLNIPSFRKLDFRAMVRLACWEVKRHSPSVLVGSSLGAMVALEVSRVQARPSLLLIAPAIGLGGRWIENLPPGDPLLFLHHAEEKELPIHRRFFEELAKVQNDREPPTAPVVVVIGTRDESVPFEHVRRVWREWESSGHLPVGSRFVEILDGDHGLVEHAGRIADEVVALANEGGDPRP